MAQRLPRSAFHAKHPLPGWRIVAHAIEADFVASDFTTAAAFIREIAVAADAAEHHPDIELRYPGRVSVTLTTHAANGLTDLDASLATAITEMAAAAGLRSDIDRLQRLEIAIDVLDLGRVLPFWRAVLGYVDEQPRNPGDLVDAVVDPLRRNPPIWFQQMDAPRPQRNRVHLDLLVPDALAEARIAAAVAAGGRLLNDAHAPAFWVLADPEDNEVCVCTWLERD
jgi:4a-hydroxytetrahydrobiopterin dehydratase